MRIRSPGSLPLAAVVWLFVVSSWAQGANGILTVTAGAPPTPPLPLVKHDDLWRYRKGTSAPPIGWQTSADASLDDSWLSGSGGFGYGDNDDTTVLADMLNGYSTVYIRRSFDIPSQVETNRHLTLVIDFDDGFVAYLDGAEVARRNAPGGPGTEPSFEATATAAHEASHGDVSPNPPLTLDLDALGDRLPPGIHVLAFLGLNAATNSSDFSFIADLMLVGGESTVSDGAFFTRIMTNTVTLSGTNTVTSSARVVVNGSDAAFNPTDGTWSKVQTLAPGVNHLNVRALDGAGNVVASTNKDVVVELSSAFVGGSLAGNTIWSAAMGIIHVTNGVTVPVGSALTIDEDAILLFAPGASIQASNATISVNGRATNMVYFFPEDGTTVWGGLVSSGTNGALLVRHAEITAGHVEVLEGATGTVEDSFLHDYLGNSPGIVHTLRAASFTERRCHVARYYEHLFQLTPVVIEDCLCEDIIGDGIDFDGAPPGSAIRRCTIRHGDIFNVDGLDLGSFVDGTPTRGVIIEGCLIYDFSFDKGVSIGEAAQDITVRNCVIYGVDAGVAVKDSSVATIYNDTIVGSNHGLNLYEKIAGQGGGHATAYNNILWGNTNSISLANGSTITVGFSDVAGAGVYPGANNLNLDPVFLEPALRDYRLATNSPCLGAGLSGTNLGALTPVGSLLVDTDGDGLPDPWEWATGLSFNSAGDADQDADNDGLTNRQEYLAGTDPRDRNSVLKFDTVERAADSVKLRFTAVAGRSYSIQFRISATDGGWMKFADVAAQPEAGAASVTNLIDPASALRFYRLVTPQQP